MPLPRPKMRPSTGMTPQIITTRLVPQVTPVATLRPAYKKQGIYRIEARTDDNGAVWQRAVDVATGQLVTRTNGMGIVWQYETVSVKRLKQMMREEMPGWKEAG